MSSKLVKKLLQQTTTQPSDNNEYDDGNSSEKQKHGKYVTKSKTNVKVSKEEMIQEHVQSMLRLDNLVQRYSSSTTQKSFNRHTTNIKQQSKKRRSNVEGASAIGNSRSSSSSFTQKPHQKRFDKESAKRSKEEGYYEDLARALKKAKKTSKRSKDGKG